MKKERIESRDWTQCAPRSVEDSEEWTVDGIPVLRGRAETPELDAGWKRINRFYQWQKRGFFRYCKKDLYPWACLEAKAAMERSAPIPCFQAELSFETTYRAGRLWSLYTRLWDNAAPGPPSVRLWGDTWDLRDGSPVSLDRFFPPRSRWKRRLLETAEAEIRRQERRGEACYHPDWPKRLRRYFHVRNYYLTAEGIAFFYPMYALAPAIEGTPVFLLPWEGEAPLKAPRE